jgi:hypothetical protein
LCFGNSDLALHDSRAIRESLELHSLSRRLQRYSNIAMAILRSWDARGIAFVRAYQVARYDRVMIPRLQLIEGSKPESFLKWLPIGVSCYFFHFSCQFAGKSSQEFAGENHPPLR